MSDSGEKDKVEVKYFVDGKEVPEKDLSPEQIASVYGEIQKIFMARNHGHPGGSFTIGNDQPRKRAKPPRRLYMAR